MIYNKHQLTAEIKGPSLFEEHLKSEIMQDAIKNHFTCKITSDYRYEQIHSALLLKMNGELVLIPKKYVFLKCILSPLSGANDKAMTADLEYVTQKYGNRINEAVSIEEFMHFVIFTARNDGEFITAKEAVKRRGAPTGRKAFLFLQQTSLDGGKHVTTHSELAADIVEWAKEYYADPKISSGYAIAALNALDYGYVDMRHCNNVAYIYQDYMFHLKKQTLLEVTHNPVILKLRQGEVLTEFVDSNGNVLKYLSLGKTLDENETLLVRGKIVQVEKGGKYGYLEGDIIGKRIDV